MADKTKDNPKARLDQALMCNRKHLNLVEKPNDRWDRPRAPFSLSRPQKKRLCSGLWISNFQMAMQQT